MAGGSLRSSNKIAGGNARPLRSMGVQSGGAGAWRNFARGSSATRSPIEALQLVAHGTEEMAENCHSCSAAGALVARIASHGRAKAKRSQRLGHPCRLIGGLTARSSAWARAAARLAARDRGASPFWSAGCRTRVESASRQLQQNSAQGRLNYCPKPRLPQAQTSRAIGSGPGALSSKPSNGVGGTFRPSASPRAAGVKNRSARRVNGAEVLHCGDEKHVAHAPCSERRARSCSRTRLSVNHPVHASVDNRK